MMVPTYDAYTNITSGEIGKARQLQRKQGKLESTQEEFADVYDAALDYFKLNEPKTWKERVQNTAPPKPVFFFIPAAAQASTALPARYRKRLGFEFATAFEK
jgi:hypothetical protein